MSDGKEKSEGTEEGASPSPPEIEAEVVTEETLAADDQTEKADEPDDAEPADEAPAKRKSTLTPGVILFIIFAVAALAIFAAWRFQSESPAASAIPQAGGSDAAAEETPDSAPTEDVAKIANDSISAQKPADLAESEAGAGPRAPVLPEPVEKEGAAGGNTALQQAAKEAFLSDAENAGESQGVSEDAASGFEFEAVEDARNAAGAVSDDVDSEAEMSESQSDPSNLSQPAVEPNEIDETLEDDIDTDNSAVEFAANDSEAPRDAPPVGNGLVAESVDADAAALADDLLKKIAGLEMRLSEERARNVRQREEIEDMRRQFEQALAERDRAADVRVADLAARLDKIENGGTIEASRRASAALALGALRRVSDNGDPFAAELDVLAAYVAEGRDMATLRRYADASVPAANALAESFAPAARAAIAAASRDAAKTPWGRLGARASNLISIRPAEPIAGDSVEAVISRAEAHIEAGDVVAGAAELETLPEPARAAMAEWIQQASARVAVDQAIASLSSSLAAPVR